MKRLFALLLALAMLLTLAACGGGKTESSTPAPAESAPAASTASGSDADAPSGDDKEPFVNKVGDAVSYGSYDGKPMEWRCIAIEDDKALLITKDCIRLDIFNEPTSDGSQIIWADSTLRAWLNGEFLNSFSAAEQAMMLETEQTRNENLDFADYPEEEVEWKPCTDKVFLLSAEEVQAYFPDDDARIAKISLSDAEKAATAGRYQKLFDYDESTGMETVEELLQNGGAVEYWLRSNGRGYMVQTVDYGGVYSDYGANQDATFKGVRPAVWVDLYGRAVGASD